MCAHMENMFACVYNSCARMSAWIFTNTFLVKNFPLMSLSLKFHKDPSFCWGDIALFVTLNNLEVKLLGVSPWIIEMRTFWDNLWSQILAYSGNKIKIWWTQKMAECDHFEERNDKFHNGILLNLRLVVSQAKLTKFYRATMAILSIKTCNYGSF